MGGIGDDFQRQTRYRRGELPGGWLDWAAQPEPFKTYPDAPRVTLPPAPEYPETPLWRALRARHSGRSYGGAPLTLTEVGACLWAANGVSRVADGLPARTAPSAGGLYPIETYLVAHRVEGLETGVYHYAVLDHALEQVEAAPALDLRRRSAAAALDQPIAGLCDGLVVWSAVMPRTLWKYGQRGHRYVYIDVGHIAENLALAAAALDLESCHIAAIYDDEADALIGVGAPGEPVLYMTTLGRAPGGR
jgi:SagB-type dehydrogenase family enzyme